MSFSGQDFQVRSKDDEPPNSRLFILCGRNVSEEELRESFEKFGTIKELWIVKDKASGDSKGVAYIKYAKTSEAAVAMEEMNGKFIGNNAKSLKVLIANSRDQAVVMESVSSREAAKQRVNDELRREEYTKVLDRSYCVSYKHLGLPAIEGSFTHFLTKLFEVLPPDFTCQIEPDKENSYAKVLAYPIEKEQKPSKSIVLNDTSRKLNVVKKEKEAGASQLKVKRKTPTKVISLLSDDDDDGGDLHAVVVKKKKVRLDGKPRPFKCHLCDCAFSQQYALQVHHRRVHVVEPSRCPFPKCNKVCRNPATLAIHRRTHNKKFVCSYKDCGLKFQSNFAKACHERTHNKVKKSITAPIKSARNEKLQVAAKANADNLKAFRKETGPVVTEIRGGRIFIKTNEERQIITSVRYDKEKYKVPSILYYVPFKDQSKKVKGHFVVTSDEHPFDWLKHQIKHSGKGFDGSGRCTNKSENMLNGEEDDYGNIVVVAIADSHDTCEDLKFTANSVAAVSNTTFKRPSGSRREMNEEERLLRLFIIVPKSMSESELKEHFAQFGDVEHCNVVRDRNTKESKGYAYVKFHRISHAAKAYEGCDRSFKPVFADPRPQKQLVDDRYSSSAHGSTTGPYDLHDYSLDQPFQPILNHHHHHLNMDSSMPLSLTASGSSMGLSSSRLTIIAHGSLNQDQLWRLCDFFPGLDYCNVRHDSKTRQGYATVVYNSSQSAAYAKEKLHGFEYPPGHRLIVKLDVTGNDSTHLGHHAHIHSRSGLLGPAGPSGGASPGQSSGTGRYNVSTQSSLNHNGATGRSTSGTTIPPDLATLAETIAQATSIIQAAGLSAASHHISHAQSGESYDPSYCSVKLPGPQPLAPIDSTVMERLFVVCHPSPPPIYALKDTFGRFGSLIDIFMLNGKNFGYAKYASKSSADEARQTLHGQEVCGMRLKVFPAEPQDQKSITGGNVNSSGQQSSTIPKGSSGIGTDQQCKRIKIDIDDEESSLLD